MVVTEVIDLKGIDLTGTPPCGVMIKNWASGAERLCGEPSRVRVHSVCGSCGNQSRVFMCAYCYSCKGTSLGCIRCAERTGIPYVGNLIFRET